MPLNKELLNQIQIKTLEEKENDKYLDIFKAYKIQMAEIIKKIKKRVP